MNSVMPQITKPRKPQVVRLAVGQISDRLVIGEKVAASVLTAAVALLILLNVFTRYFDYALYWVDESAIYAMVWATLVAASLGVRKRQLIPVTLVLDFVPPRVRQGMMIINDAIVLAFGCMMIWLCWTWYSPDQLIQADFQIRTFVMNTGNFIYGEPTMTIGIPKFWVWLILPIFSITLTIHALANFLDTLAEFSGSGLPTAMQEKTR